MKYKILTLFTISLIFGCILISNNQSSSELIKKSKISDLKVSSSEEWIQSWGYDEVDHGYSVAIDSNGNSYIAGDVTQNGVLNATVIKYSSSGIYQWHRTWGGLSSESANSIFIDNLDNIYITGSARSFNTSFDVFILRYNSGGDLIWNRTWGGSNYETGTGIVVDNQGNVYVTGITSSYGPGGQSVMLLEYNSTGHLQDSNIWGGVFDDRPSSIAKDSIGNLFVSGETNSYGAGNADVFILKYNTTRSLEWNTTWGSTTLDRPSGLAIDSINNLYISGFTYHPDANAKFFIAKLSPTGLPLWSEIWGSTFLDIGGFVGIDSSNNAYFAGYTQGYNAGIQDIYVAKFSVEGVKLWEDLWDSGDTDVVHQIVIESSTDNIFIVGESKGFSLEKDFQIILIKNPTFPTSTINNPSNQSIPGFNFVILICVTIVTIVASIKKKKNYRIK